MFKILFIPVSLLLIVSCSTDTINDMPNEGITVDLIQNPKTLRDGKKVEMPIMKFKSKHHTFGELVQGEKVKHTFKFTNTGNTPLIINNAKATCGCTVPSWPKEPILPNEKGAIEVVFNSEGKMGAFNKTITINANTMPNTNKISISGNIILN